MSKKWFWILAFLLAVFAKSVIAYYYASVDGDKSMMAIGAMNIAGGKGYTYPLVSLQHVDTTSQRPVVEWPPLYSLLVALALQVYDDIETACFLIDVFSALIGLLFFVLLMRELKLPGSISLLLLFFKAFELNTAILYSYPTDIWAVNAWLAVLFFLLKYFRSPSTGTLVGFTLASVATFFFRYAYLPIALIIPVLCLWNERRLRKPFYGVLASIASGALCLLLYNYLVSGQPVYVIQMDKKFAPENILQLAPIIWLAFINTDFYAMQVSLKTPFSYGQFYSFLRISSAVVLVILMMAYARRFIRWRPISLKGIFSRFTYYAGAVAIATILSLIYLSLTTDSLIPGTNVRWTFVREERYFLLPATVLLLATASWLYAEKSRPVFLKIVFIALCGIEILHGAYIIGKNATKSKSSYSAMSRWLDRRSDYLDSLFDAERQKGRQVIAVTDQYGFITFAIQRGIRVSRNINELDSALGFNQPTTLVMIIGTESARQHQPLIRRRQFQFLIELDGYMILKREFDNSDN